MRTAEDPAAKKIIEILHNAPRSIPIVADHELRHETNADLLETETGPTATDDEIVGHERRPDLVWDKTRGLCVRVYGDGAQSFIFVYRVENRQHFIKIGKTPLWSLEAARDRAKKLRSILDQGEDPALYHRQNNVGPVENVLRYIAEQLQTNP